MVTIKELADSIGISKVAVNKWLERNGYKEQLKKVGNRFYVPDDAEQAIRAYMADREQKKAETINTASDTEKTLTEEIIALLREQLEQKDAEINRLYQQVENLQAINADMVKAVRESNAIQYHQLTEPEKAEEPIKADEKREDLDEEPRKKSFWSWFRR